MLHNKGGNKTLVKNSTLPTNIQYLKIHERNWIWWQPHKDTQTDWYEQELIQMKKMQHEVYNTKPQNVRFPSYALLIHRLLILDVSLVCGRWSYSSATLGRRVLTQFWNEKTTYGRRSIPKVSVQCRQIQVEISFSKVGTDLRDASR